MKVLMIAVCWVPNGATLKEAWRSETIMRADSCMEMVNMFGQGGKVAAITVRCLPVEGPFQ